MHTVVHARGGAEVGTESRMGRARHLAWCAAAVVLLAAAGCSDDGDTVSVTGTPAPTTTSAATTTSAGGPGSTAAAPSAPATAPTVTVVETELGAVLADGEGRTLYVFTQDTRGMSNCTGACVQTWPRHTADAVVSGAGVDPADLGTITVDGEQQVTIDGMPLYRFAGDVEPGDVNGHGIGGNWFAVRADGTIVR